ncbi:factor H binding protein domain-containing protein [Neisseria sicca]|uniref:factor H binding protein domain-containing protein n=1 Tax=Neisseria sicca TaxID=490 RepID=UPI001958F09D|nr:factor H binding protein domain-containing protein [Neisseria sicca]VTX49092.1 Uncharacterised protein [Neisseria sicca]
MSLQKISAATIIALSLAACSSGSDSPNSTLPNTNPTVTNPSNGNQTNNGNAAANNENNAASNGNTAANGNNPANSGNTAANNQPPRVDFLVSYGGLKTNVNEDIQKLAKDLGASGATVKSYNVTLGNQSSSGSNINLSGYPLKELKLNQNFQETAIANASGNNYTVTRSGKAHIYRQNYSLIAGINPTNTTVRGPQVNESENLDNTYILIKGQTTQTLPTAGKFDYSGIASDGKTRGKLAYSVDFDSKKGSGKITGIGSDINLNEASIGEVSHTNEIDNTVIKGHGIQGSSSRGNYALGFFGPNAEEIVGTVNDTVNDGEIGFAGSH